MKKTIEIAVNVNNSLEEIAIKKVLENLATAPLDVLQRLATLNTDKGHKALRSEFNWSIIKRFA